MNTAKNNSRAKLHILLVDDDEEDFIITQDLLEEIPERHYNLEWVDSYTRAQEAIGRQEHDVYLIDFRLGANNGLDLIKEAKESGINAPFILLTGQGDIETDKQAMIVGAADYLVKSTLNPHILERSIRYSISHNQDLKAIRELNAELEGRVEKRTEELSYTVTRLEQVNQELEKEIEERKLTEQALQESQNLYNAIAENFPNGTINVYDRELRYLFVAGKELEKLGFQQEDLIGKTMREVLPPDQAQHFETQITPVFHGKNAFFEVFHQENHYLFNAVPLPPTQGKKVEQVLTVVENITHRKQMEMEMIRALEKEKELNELKSRFVSMASHEFRTPLSTILSSVSLIGKYPETEQQDKREKHVNKIRSAVQNLTDILDDLLSISKLEEGKVQNNPESIELQPFIESVIDEMKEEEQEEDRIHFDHDDSLDFVVSDKRMLHNILLNLLSNAIKYSPENAPIDLSTRKNGQCMTLSVADQGIGIPEKEQKELFTRFFRAENANNIQGTGLGLHIVKKYLELLNGDIEVESKAGEGTTFRVNIPLQTVPSPTDGLP